VTRAIQTDIDLLWVIDG